MNRKKILKRINSLDPVKDHMEIIHLSTLHEFPLQTARSLEFALFRTFAVPSIGSLLDKSGEFGKRPQKRYDDTDLILSEIIEHGYDSERGIAAINRLNTIHQRFRISNEDFLYVLSTFVVEPTRWLDRFGYRTTTRNEKIAAHTFWKIVGEKMHIKNIPATYDELEAFNIQYEQQYFAFHEGSRKVADATVNLFLGWYMPRFMWSVGRPFMIAVLDEPLRKAFRYDKPNVLVNAVTKILLTIGGQLLYLKPVSDKPFRRTQLKRKTYPQGYEIDQLGPKPYGVKESSDQSAYQD
jgi:hypothetical protein